MGFEQAAPPTAIGEPGVALHVPPDAFAPSFSSPPFAPPIRPPGGFTPTSSARLPGGVYGDGARLEHYEDSAHNSHHRASSENGHKDSPGPNVLGQHDQLLPWVEAEGIGVGRAPPP